MHPPQPSWAVVVPVKGGPLGKSRLDLPVDARLALADAFARDTVTALLAGAGVVQVLVVTADAGVAQWASSVGAEVVADPGGGLDAAVAAGAVAAHDVTHVAVVLGDHPALTPGDVAAALDAAARHSRAVLPDADGTGTALLTWPVAETPRTAFGAGSARAHVGLGHTLLELDVPGLRVDVDDAASLERAVVLGLGPATRAALDRDSVRGVQASIHRVEGDGSGSALLDDGREVTVGPGAAQESGLRHLRVGQRVSVELDDTGTHATRVWIVGIGPGEVIR